MYRAVCRLDPSHARARTHLALCEQLIRPPGSPPTREWHDTLSTLYATMGLELTRHDTEMAEIAGLVLENIQQKFRTPEGRAGQPFLDHLKIGRDGGLLGLDLRKTPLVDLSPLRGLPLGYVYLAGCRVTDLGPLAGSPVTTLNISSTLVADISPLREMTALRNMTAHDGKFSDLSPLQDIPMEWMDISGSAVTDISPLRGKPLRVLRLGYTKVSDLSPLAGLPLRELECDAIPALDLSPLSQCPQLIYLKLSRTGVQSLEVIRDLKLRYLYFDHTQVSDLTPLADMPLNGIGFYNTPVTDVAPLLKYPTLTHIGLSESVKNVEVLRALPNLRRISFRVGADGLPTQTAAEFWKERDAAK
jgi:eukaryotic-like serine/threonine-protein kinase